VTFERNPLLKRRVSCDDISTYLVGKLRFVSATFTCPCMQRCTTYLVIQGTFGLQLAVADCDGVSYMVIHGTLIIRNSFVSTE